MAEMKCSRLDYSIGYLDATIKNPSKELRSGEIEILQRQLDLLRKATQKDEVMAIKLAESFGLPSSATDAPLFEQQLDPTG